MAVRATAGVPLVIGTAGTCGADDAVDWLRASSRRGNLLANTLLARIYWERANATEDDAAKEAALDEVLENYLHATRYQGTRGGAVLKWITRPSQDLRGRTVLVVDDILDEGLTLAAILDYCREQGASAVYSAVLVEKKHDRKAANQQADFVGLHIEDRYVFGYGMDYHGYLRNVKGIYAVADS